MLLKRPSDGTDETLSQTEERINAANVLSELCDNEGFSRVFSGDESVVAKLCSAFQYNETIGAAAQVLRSLLRTVNLHGAKRRPMLSINNYEEDEDQEYSLPNAVDFAISDYRVLDRCCSLLKEPLGADTEGATRNGETSGANRSSLMNTTYGNTIMPFGSARLRALDLLAEVVRVGTERMKEELVERGFFRTAMQLCIRYEWNSFVHVRVEALFTEIFRSSSPHSKTFREGVLASSRLCDLILEG